MNSAVPAVSGCVVLLHPLQQGRHVLREVILNDDPAGFPRGEKRCDVFEELQEQTVRLADVDRLNMSNMRTVTRVSQDPPGITPESEFLSAHPGTLGLHQCIPQEVARVSHSISLHQSKDHGSKPRLRFGMKPKAATRSAIPLIQEIRQ